MAFQIQKLGKLLDMGASSLDGSVLGIDVGASSLKIVQLGAGKNGAALQTYGELQLGPYGGVGIGETTLLDPQKMTTALVDIVREASATAKSCILSMPHSASFIAVARFPTLDQAQLPSMVPIEARKYIPMAMSEISLDWFVIPETTTAATPPTTTRILMAAVHNESQKRLRNAVQNAGIAVIGNEIEPFSVVRSSIHESDTSVLLADFGASSTKTHIVGSGILEETHRVPIGGADATRALSGALKLSFDEAESLKRSVGLADGATKDAMLPTIDRIISDLTRSIDRYEREEGRRINSIVGTGGALLLPGFEARLAEVTGREVRRADPFGKVEYPAFLNETLKDAGPSFSVAIGVALRKFMG